MHLGLLMAKLKSLPGIKNSLGGLVRHLSETLFHAALQKIGVYVERLTTDEDHKKLAQ